MLSILLSQFGIAQVKHLDFKTLAKIREGIKNQDAQFSSVQRPEGGFASPVTQQFSLNPKTAVYVQDFENFTQGDMTFIDNDGLPPNEIIQPIFGEGSNWIVDIIDESGNHAASSTSWIEEGNQTADDWMITPLIHLNSAAVDPYFLIWDAGSVTSFAPDGYEVLISTTGTDLEDFLPIFSIDAENEYPLTSRSLNLTDLGYTGDVYIAFHHNSTYKYILMVDNITVTEVSPASNVGLSNLYTSSFAAFGQEMHVAGAFKNFSSTNLTNLKVNWTINGFGPFEKVVDSLDIPLMATGNYTLTIPKLVSGTTVQVVGVNEVKAWVSEVNGVSYTGATNDTASTEFELSTDYSYFMNFDRYVDGDMTKIDNDTVVPFGNPYLNNWNTIEVGPADFAMISVSLEAGGPVDKWIITPPIEITSGDFLFWEVQGRGPDWDEVLEILVSTTGTNISDFTSLGVYHEKSELWTLRNLDLTEYASQTIHIAFRDITNSQTAILINNLLIKPFAGLDLGLMKLNTSRFIVANEENKVAGVLKNELGDVINSYTLNYQFNDGEVFTQSFSGLSIPSLATVAFEMTETFAFTEVGTHSLKVWISEVNGGVDINTANDTAYLGVQVVSFLPERKLVIEESTGTWCGWCVRGIVYMDSIYKAYPDSFIPIAVHGFDPMEVTAYNEGLVSFPGSTGGFPAAFIERKYVTDPFNAFESYAANIDDFGVANLDLVATIDTNRNLTASVSATFAATLQGDYRFALVITEDNVHGTSSAYDQHNYYAGGANGPMGGFENLPETIPAADMYYDFVARDILGGFTGQENSLPESIEVNSTHTYTFNYTVPAEYNLDELKAIVLLIDNQTGQIMNAADIEIPYGVSEMAGLSIYMYPNPVTQVLTVTNAANSNIQLINTMGQVLYAADCSQSTAQINVASFVPGVYYVRISKEEKVGTGKVVIK